MDQATSVTYATARGYSDWTALTATLQSQALLRASDFIAANYTLLSTLTPEQQAKYDAAQFLIARDLALNPVTMPIRATANVAKETSELGDLKKSVEYEAAPSDPYPQATALLAPLRVNSGSSGVWFGKLVR